jgi:hypothetical protein
VVPDGTLWQVLYKEDGTRQGGPTEATESCIYVGKSYQCDHAKEHKNFCFTLSHVNIFTLEKFKWFANQLCYMNQYTESLFSKTAIEEFLGCPLPK